MMLATYLYCNRFHESKSVLICALRCPYWRGCKDWAAALAEKKEKIAAEVSEYATRKAVTVNPDVWDPLARRTRRRKSTGPVVAPPIGAHGARRAPPARDDTRASLIPAHTGKQIMTNEEKLAERKTLPVTGPRETAAKVRPTLKRKPNVARQAPRAGAKTANSQSVVYLILEKNGRYREVKSEEEMKRIAVQIAGKGKKGVRFARATLLEAEITFRPAR